MVRRKPVPASRTRDSIFKRPLDLLFLIYFILHVPITILSDAQPLYQDILQSKVLEDTMRFWVQLSGDPLMKTAYPGSKKLAWFNGILFIETFLQTPFFLFAIYGLLKSIYLFAIRD
jgi:hypothetical protein